MARALVLGVGNILMQDEGLGVRALEWLNSHFAFPSAPVGQDGRSDNGVEQAVSLSGGAEQTNSSSNNEVTLIDGGTMGLDLLHYLEGIDHLLILDAINADKLPGEIITLSGDAVPAFLGMKISPHQIGVQELLATAQLMGYTPPKVVIFGLQPAWLRVGVELSPAVAGQIETLAHLALSQLEKWGYQVEKTQIPSKAHI